MVQGTVESGGPHPAANALPPTRAAVDDGVGHHRGQSRALVPEAVRIEVVDPLVPGQPERVVPFHVQPGVHTDAEADGALHGLADPLEFLDGSLVVNLDLADFVLEDLSQLLDAVPVDDVEGARGCGPDVAHGGWRGAVAGAVHHAAEVGETPPLLAQVSDRLVPVVSVGLPVGSDVEVEDQVAEHWNVLDTMGEQVLSASIVLQFLLQQFGREVRPTPELGIPALVREGPVAAVPPGTPIPERRIAGPNRGSALGLARALGHEIESIADRVGQVI